jgi:hypothetical protein
MLHLKDNIDYNQIYDFHDRDTRGAYNATLAIDQAPFDNVKLFRGELIVNTPFKFGYHFGAKIYDLVAIGFAGLYLLSDRVTNLLRDHQITGWKTYPAKLYDKKGNEFGGYSIFSVTGRCGPIDRSKSEKFIKDPYVPGGGAANMLRGTYPDLSTWDGNDVFTANGGTAYTFVTKKVRDLLVKNKATNILMEKLTEIEQIDHTIPIEVSQESMDWFLGTLKKQ